MEYFYIWFIAVLVIVIVSPKERVKTAREFFVQVLPKIPITSIIKTLKELKKK